MRLSSYIMNTYSNYLVSTGIQGLVFINFNILPKGGIGSLGGIIWNEQNNNFISFFVENSLLEEEIGLQILQLWQICLRNDRPRK